MARPRIAPTLRSPVMSELRSLRAEISHKRDDRLLTEGEACVAFRICSRVEAIEVARLRRLSAPAPGHKRRDGR